MEREAEIAPRARGGILAVEHADKTELAVNLDLGRPLQDDGLVLTEDVLCNWDLVERELKSKGVVKRGGVWKKERRKIYPC
jgi:hypothetical protein